MDDKNLLSSDDGAPLLARRALRHIPVNLPRASVPGEGIFLNLWREFLTSNPDALSAIFGDLCEPLDQRGARVAASFMVWMGCNAGHAFTYEAERLAASWPGLRPGDAFVAAWAISNLRWYGTNSGIITTEAMLTPGGVPRLHSHISYAVDWRRVYSPTQYDNDVLSCMVRWWATQQAAELRQIATPLIESANRRERTKWFGRGPDQPEGTPSAPSGSSCLVHGECVDPRGRAVPRRPD